MVHLNRLETVVQGFWATKLAGGSRARTRKAMERTVSSVFPNNQEISGDAENVNVQSARPR